jgi:hypothetical protein
MTLKYTSFVSQHLIGLGDGSSRFLEEVTAPIYRDWILPAPMLCYRFLGLLPSQPSSLLSPLDLAPDALLLPVYSMPSIARKRWCTPDNTLSSPISAGFACISREYYICSLKTAHSSVTNTSMLQNIFCTLRPGCITVIAAVS